MSNDGGNNKSDGESTYDRKQQAGVKKGSTYETFRDGKSQGIDYGVKESVENYKEEQFKNSGKVDKITSPFMMVNLFGNALLDPLNKGSVKTRTMFTDKVLTSKNAKKNIGYTSAEFKSLSVDKQNEVYAGYMEGRMSGGTDAYGNVKSGWSKDATGTWKEQGGNDTPKRLTEKQIETESAAEIEKDTRTEEEKEEDYKKVKGLKGSRSLFGNAGGRGYFDPA